MQTQAFAAPDSKKMIAVGHSGSILRSGNGGSSWTIQSSGTTADLLGVSFADAKATWNAQFSGTTNILNAVSFVDANTGTAVGQKMES